MDLLLVFLSTLLEQSHLQQMVLSLLTLFQHQHLLLIYVSKTKHKLLLLKTFTHLLLQASFSKVLRLEFQTLKVLKQMLELSLPLQLRQTAHMVLV